MKVIKTTDGDRIMVHIPEMDEPFDSSTSGLIAKYGFLYEPGAPFRYRIRALDSMFAHMGGHTKWEEIEITEEEFSRLRNLPVLHPGPRDKGCEVYEG